MTSWEPELDSVRWPKGKSSKGMKSNNVILCPELSGFVGIVTHCYGCEYAFNGTCSSFKEKITQNPGIIDELFQPFPELRYQPHTENLIVYRNKLLDLNKIKKVKSVKYKKTLFRVKNKYQLVIRFFPRYEKFNAELSEIKFFDPIGKKIVPFWELPENNKTGDILYSIEKDENLADKLILMETLND